MDKMLLNNQELGPKNIGTHIKMNKEILPTFNSFTISNLIPGYNDLFLRK